MNAQEMYKEYYIHLTREQYEALDKKAMEELVKQEIVKTANKLGSYYAVTVKVMAEADINDLGDFFDGLTKNKRVVGQVLVTLYSKCESHKTAPDLTCPSCKNDEYRVLYLTQHLESELGSSKLTIYSSKRLIIQEEE